MLHGATCTTQMPLKLFLNTIPNMPVLSEHQLETVQRAARKHVLAKWVESKSFFVIHSLIVASASSNSVVSSDNVHQRFLVCSDYEPGMLQLSEWLVCVCPDGGLAPSPTGVRF